MRNDFLCQKINNIFFPILLGDTVHAQNSYSTSAPALNHNASSATKELDDLMASLSDFKVGKSFFTFIIIQDEKYIFLTLNGNFS